MNIITVVAPLIKFIIQIVDNNEDKGSSYEKFNG